MAYGEEIRGWYREEIGRIRDAGLLKQERYIHGIQGAEIEVEFPPGSPPRKVINLCANNYLGFSGHPEVIDFITSLLAQAQPAAGKSP